VTIGAESNDPNFTDVIGHGTAVMAAIKEKAPEADYFAVRVFYRSLRTTVDLLLRAIEWSIANRIDVINLSLGTTNPAHRERFAPVVAKARESGLILISARDAEGTPALPGISTGIVRAKYITQGPRRRGWLSSHPATRAHCRACLKPGICMASVLLLRMQPVL